MMRKRIITDTNIWYGISTQEIINISKDYQLVIPIILLNEIYTSPNISSNEREFENLKKAVNTILQNLKHIEIIEFYPFQYLLKNLYPDIKKAQNSKFYIDEFKALVKLNYDDVKDKGAQRGDISGLTDYINKTSMGYKKIINKNLESKTKFKKLDTLKLTESLILKYANDILGTENENFPKINELTIENELLLKTFDELLRDVSTITTKKIEDNDWVDIFNLIYIGNDDLYWTHEVSKKNLIIKSGLENYLYKK